MFFSDVFLKLKQSRPTLFMKTETVRTRLEDLISFGFSKHKNIFNVLGSSSLGAFSYFLSQNLSKEINSLPKVVIVSSLQAAQELERSLGYFSSEFRCHVLQHFDVSPFSGLYPSPGVSRSRTRFLYWAARAQKTDIFILPVSALMQMSVPFFDFSKRCHLLKQGDELPQNLAEFLNSLGYQAAPLVEDIGQYSVRGGIVDLYSPAEDFPIRLELFGDQIESLRTFSLNDQRSLSEVSVLNLAPTLEVEFNDENIEELIKKFRDDLKGRKVSYAEIDEVVRSISLKNYFPGSEFLLDRKSVV